MTLLDQGVGASANINNINVESYDEEIRISLNSNTADEGHEEDVITITSWKERALNQSPDGESQNKSVFYF